MQVTRARALPPRGWVAALRASFAYTVVCWEAYGPLSLSLLAFPCALGSGPGVLGHPGEQPVSELLSSCVAPGAHPGSRPSLIF